MISFSDSKQVGLTVLMLVVAISSFAKGEGSFLLLGNITGLAGQTNVYLLSKDMLAVDSCVIEDGKFVFKGNVDGADYYFLALDRSFGKGVSNRLWLSEGEQQVSGSLGQWNKLQLTGSEAHNDYVNVLELAGQAESIEVSRQVWIDFVRQQPNSLYAPYLLLQLEDAAQRVALYGLLTERVLSSHWGLALGRKVRAESAKASGKIPDFKVTSPDGTEASILELVSKSTYTLIDFWASWCKPCRGAIPKLKEAYDAYHAKGFNIIGVSIDASETDWKKALAEDNTPWMHGLDNVEQAAKNLFGISGVPQYILVDSEGRVIASKVTVGEAYRIPAQRKFEASKGWLEILDELFNTPNDWHMRDSKEDGVLGASIDKAYRELLSGQGGDTVLVAVIDSGVDTLHNDLVPVLWKNPKETTNDSDDDENGYNDDRWGWSYIGGATGNVHHDNMELARQLKWMDERFESVDAASLSKKANAEYQRYTKLKAEFKERIDPFKSQKSFYELVLGALDSVVMLIGKEAPTLADFKVFEPQSVNQKYAKVKAVEGMEDGRDFATYRREAYEQPLAQVELKLNTHFNPDFDSRHIVGDNYADKTERHYGNADVQGPDATHGTHVSGIIGAVRHNGIGMDGVADKVKLLTVRAIPDGDERDKDVANAIRYAVDNGAKVINMSFGKAHSPDRKIVKQAIRYAGRKDVLLVHAAGNDGKSIDHRPNFPTARYGKRGRFKHMITVGASGATRENIVAPFSNYGKQNVDVFAPGVQIYSTVPGNGYAKHDGTSMAAPVVSGIAAVLRSYFPELSAREVKELIEAGVTKIEGPVKRPGKLDVEMRDLCRTGGIVNAYESVRLALERRKK